MTRGTMRKASRCSFINTWSWGGRLLAFNLDPHFNNTPDGLIFANLPQPSRRLLEFYMGRDCAAGYLRYHLEVDRLRRNTTGLGHGLRKGGARRRREVTNGGQPFPPHDHGFLMKPALRLVFSAWLSYNLFLSKSSTIVPRYAAERGNQRPWNLGNDRTCLNKSI
jgi:hypothetical protein